MLRLRSSPDHGLVWYGSEFLRGLGQAFVMFAIVLFAVHRLDSMARWSWVLLLVSTATIGSLWVLPRIRVRSLATWLVLSLTLCAGGLGIMLVSGPPWVEITAMALGYLAYSLGHTLVSTYEFPFAFGLFAQQTAVARVYTFNTVGNVVGFVLIFGTPLAHRPLAWLIALAAMVLFVTAALRLPLALDRTAPRLSPSKSPHFSRRSLLLVYSSSALLGVGFTVVPTYQALMLTHFYGLPYGRAAAICVLYYAGLVLGSMALGRLRHPPRLMPRLLVLLAASIGLVFMHSPVPQSLYLFGLGFLMSQLGAEVERRLLTSFPATAHVPFSQHRGTARLLASVGSLWLAGYAARAGLGFVYGGLALVFCAGIPILRWLSSADDRPAPVADAPHPRLVAQVRPRRGSVMEP